MHWTNILELNTKVIGYILTSRLTYYMYFFSIVTFKYVAEIIDMLLSPIVRIVKLWQKTNGIPFGSHLWIIDIEITNLQFGVLVKLLKKWPAPNLKTTIKISNMWQNEKIKLFSNNFGKNICLDTMKNRSILKRFWIK